MLAFDVVCDGLSFPTSVAFDDRGIPHVTEAGLPFGGARPGGRLLRIEPGDLRIVLDGLRAPVTGLAYHAGAFFLSEGGHPSRIARVDRKGEATTVVGDLPGPGNYHVNMAALDRAGWLYFGQGAMTNLGIIGLDESELGPRRLPHAHDVPGRDIVLAGVNVETRDPLRDGAPARTGAFVPFGVATERGQRIAGATRCTAAVLRCRTDGSQLELFAWGLRNPFALGFAPDGRLLCIDQGPDDRGSRAAGEAPDLLFHVRRGAWYGWPDFIGGEPITSPRFRPERGAPPVFVLADHSALPVPERALYQFVPHTAAAKFDFLPQGVPRVGGAMAVALFGDARPLTAPPGERVGRSFVLLDLRRTPAERAIALPAARPIDVKWNPVDQHLYLLDFGHFEMAPGGKLEAVPASGRLVRIAIGDLQS